MTYVLYAIAEKGHGHVVEIGRYESLSEIMIRIELFAPDTVLTIEEESEDATTN